MTPRQQISYHNVDELRKNSFKIFSRITAFRYDYYEDGTFLIDQIGNHIIFTSYKESWSVIAATEAKDVLSSSMKRLQRELNQNSQMHSEAYSRFVEPMDLFDLLARADEIDLEY